MRVMNVMAVCIRLNASVGSSTVAGCAVAPAAAVAVACRITRLSRSLIPPLLLHWTSTDAKQHALGTQHRCALQA
jgi:hypothetical protein